MSGKYSRSTSVYDFYTKQKSKDFLHKKIISDRRLIGGIIIGVFLTIVTIVLQCIAYFTPHWKEISPNTHSLYIDGVDALIRSETLVYFNSIHRFTRHSYGLFQRCEYLLNNSSKFINKREEILHMDLNKHQKICANNFLPSYKDKQFDECHSLQYYRFCSTTNGKNFDINNDYLFAAFNIVSNSRINNDSTSSCDCHYPRYVKFCQIFGIFALIFLFLTAILFSVFPFLKTRQHRLIVKIFGVLSSLFSILCILINLLVILNHLEYESIAYLADIERHYRSNEIYKLSLDTKEAINRFTSSINIEIGYSTIIGWVAFVLSIVDGILLMFTCKIRHIPHDIELLFTGISTDSPQSAVKIENKVHQTSTTPLTSTSNTTVSQQIPPPLPAKPMISNFEEQPMIHSSTPPLPPKPVINNFNKQSMTRLPPSCLKRSCGHRTHFSDEV